MFHFSQLVTKFRQIRFVKVKEISFDHIYNQDFTSDHGIEGQRLNHLGLVSLIYV